MNKQLVKKDKTIYMRKEVIWLLEQEHQINKAAREDSHAIYMALNDLTNVAVVINRAAYRQTGNGLIQELNDLSPTLNKQATEYKNLVVKLGYTDDDLAPFLATLSDLNDAINRGLRGDGGHALRQLYPDDPLSRFFPDPPIRVDKDRLFVGKRAAELNEQYDGKPHGKWLKFGLQILSELETKENPDEQEDSAYRWLFRWGNDPERLRKETRRAYEDYIHTH